MKKIWTKIKLHIYCPTAIRIYVQELLYGAHHMGLYFISQCKGYFLPQKTSFLRRLTISLHMYMILWYVIYIWLLNHELYSVQQNTIAWELRNDLVTLHRRLKMKLLSFYSAVKPDMRTHIGSHKRKKSIS